MPSTTCPPAERLEQFAANALPPEVAAAVREHAVGCEKCGARLAELNMLAETRDPEGAARGWTGEILSPRRSPARAWASSEASVGEESAPLKPGDTLGRFVVEGFLAEGGMGKVYAGRDPALGRPVALKLLRRGTPGGEDSTPHHARLLREAQAMARLSHPNVVTVYEVGEVDGRLFVAMELVEGGTLRAWLSAEARTVDQILDVLTAAGRGLAAAHAAGIVHRDFKPDNVLIGLGGRARVTDFGLARPLPAIGTPAGPAFDTPVATPAMSPTHTPLPGDALTPSGAFAGTPAYMAPEQLRGGEVDGRADVFAFCAALHEGLYGRAPFPAKTLYELSQRIATGQVAAPPPGARVPPWLRRLILKGLADAKEQRFASMDALLDALERGRKRAVLQRRGLWLGTALVVVLALVGASAIWKARRAARLPTGRVPVAVAIAGARDDPQQAWLGQVLGELLGTELGASPRLRLIPPETVALLAQEGPLPPRGAEGALESREGLRRLGQGLGARLVAAGDVARDGSAVRLSLRLWDTRDGELLAETTESGELPRLADLVVRAGAQLRRAAGEDERTAGEAPVFSFPADPEAARLTALGLSRYRAFDVPGAIDALEQAAKLAPDNPRVLAALAEAQVAGGRDGKARASAQRALGLAAGLPREQRLQIELLLRRASNDREKAVELGRALWTLLPDDLEAGLRLARQYIWARRDKEGLQVLAEMRRLPPPSNEDPRIDLAEAELTGGNGDHQASLAAARRALAKASARGLPAEVAFATYYEGLELRNAGDAPLAREKLSRSVEQYRALGDRFAEARAETVYATVLADGGDLPGARALFERSAALYREMGDLSGEAVLFNNLGILMRRARDLHAARDYLESGRKAWEALNDRPGGASTLSALAHVNQDLGELDKARVFYETSVQWRREVSAPLLTISLAGLADVRLQADDLPEARRLCAEAVAAVKPGDQVRGATALLCTAKVELADGHLAEALSAAQEAAARFSKSSQLDDGAEAECLQTAALLALGRVPDAQAAARRAAALLTGTKSELARADVAVAVARAEAAALGRPDPKSLEALQAALEKARRAGVVEDQYECRLALGELGLKGGKPTAAKDLQALAAEARRTGHAWTARRAAKAARR